MREELTVETKMGTLVAYASTDPDNPGIFIDLRRRGHDAELNLSGTECRQGDENAEPRLVTHVWGDGAQEDTTHDVTHKREDEYFSPDYKRLAKLKNYAACELDRFNAAMTLYRSNADPKDISDEDLYILYTKWSDVCDGYGTPMWNSPDYGKLLADTRIKNKYKDELIRRGIL